MISLDKSNGSCNTLDDLLITICVLKKTKYENLNGFNMIARINNYITFRNRKKEEKVIQIKSKITNCFWRKSKNHVLEEHYVWNRNTCSCKINKYLKSIIGDAVVTSGEIIYVLANSYSNLTNFNEKKSLKWETSIFDLPFY